eukprot:3026703-Pleurochrysis_carterae.AAC.2
MKALPRALESKALFCSRASSSASTSRMAETVGASRPVGVRHRYLDVEQGSREFTDTAYNV